MAASADLPLDPELLPANSGPGDCVTRRVTGPGGAYRWDRIECERQPAVWQDHDQWGYGRRLDIQTQTALAMETAIKAATPGWPLTDCGCGRL
jgi:hypothetical protein